MYGREQRVLVCHYLLFIHGARSYLKHLNRDNHELGLWVTQLEQRAHKNVIAVALANEMARIARAVLTHQQVYHSSTLAH